jgi:prevent-host-death family protein
MKKTTLESFTSDPGHFLEEARSERILVTKNGRPMAVVMGVDEMDEEDIGYATSPEFWRMIEERRRQPTIPLEEVERLLIEDTSGSDDHEARAD